MSLKDLKKLNRYTDHLESVEFLRECVEWLNNRAEYLNEDKSTLQLMDEYGKEIQNQ